MTAPIIVTILMVLYYIAYFGFLIALLSGVHLAASLLAALWVMWALGKQVYPLAGKFTDIALDDREKEAQA